MTDLETDPIAAVGEQPSGDDGLYLGDAIHLFLSAKRAGGRSSRTLDEYRKKLDLFQRWAARRLDGEDAVDAHYIDVGADEVEAYVVHLKERGLSDTSRKGHLAVLKSFFKTVSKRAKLPDPTDDLDEVRFHQRAPKRSYLTRREADILLSAVERAATGTEAVNHDEGSLRAARRAAFARALAARDHAAFSAMIYAGLRIEETSALEPEDISLARGAEEVRVAKGKGNKERLVPMNRKLKRSLRRYLEARDGLIVAGADTGAAGEPLAARLFLNERGHGVTENTLRRRLYSWVRKSGLKKADIKPHDLRRTFATWFLQENPDKFRELADLWGTPTSRR